jgi:hypothetical protein
MSRAPAIAVLLAAAVFSPPSLEGQMRIPQHLNIPQGINMGPHFSTVHLSPSGLSVMSPRPVSRRGPFVQTRPFRHHFRFDVFFGNSCFANPFFNPFFCRRFFSSNRFLSAQPVFVPYPVYTAPYYQGTEQTPTTVADRGSDLAIELERLTDEVERLRVKQTAREQMQQAPLQSSPSTEENTTSTTLIFHDGRRRQIRNYAIVGRTLWVFTEQRARKIPLSDLDVEATKTVNAEQGVEVPLE